MQNSLVWKLTFAFMLVAVITAGLVALFIRLTSADRLSLLIVDQQRNNLKTTLIEYYTTNNSWDGVDEDWEQIRHRIVPFPTPPGHLEEQPPPQIENRPPPNKLQVFFGLADAQGRVIVPVNPQYPAGSLIPPDNIKEGTSIVVDGEQIGTILNTPLRPQFNPAENLFLERTNEALFYAIVGAIFVALVIGILLARTLTHPLKALTQAAQKITQGELEQEVIVTSKDEIGQLAFAFNSMSHEVARVNQMRRQMTADIAHDLRTPLMVIAGYIESMKEGVLQPTPTRLALIYSEIERLQNLVGDLRMLSQADAGELSLHPQPISPKLLLERVAQTFTQPAETQHITLSVEADESLPDIYVDEDRMMQIFSNLISNALRYTPGDGTIHLSAKLRMA